MFLNCICYNLHFSKMKLSKSVFVSLSSSVKSNIKSFLTTTCLSELRDSSHHL